MCAGVGCVVSGGGGERETMTFAPKKYKNAPTATSFRLHPPLISDFAESGSHLRVVDSPSSFLVSALAETGEDRHSSSASLSPSASERPVGLLGSFLGTNRSLLQEGLVLSRRSERVLAAAAAVLRLRSTVTLTHAFRSRAAAGAAPRELAPKEVRIGSDYRASSASTHKSVLRLKN